jgi:hypothetical protein
LQIVTLKKYLPIRHAVLDRRVISGKAGRPCKKTAGDGTGVGGYNQFGAFKLNIWSQLALLNDNLRDSDPL